jgi:hypothetical protein
MALISAKTILTSLSLFHITLGFFFLTSPVTIADQALVYIVGESMALVSSSPPTANIGGIRWICGGERAATHPRGTREGCLQE